MKRSQFRKCLQNRIWLIKIIALAHIVLSPVLLPIYMMFRAETHEMICGYFSECIVALKKIEEG
jgi:hypothetical protein